MAHKYLLEVGDKVKINNPYQLFLNGKEGTIKHFGEHALPRRLSSKLRKPGVYVDKQDIFLVLKPADVVVNTKNPLVELVDKELEKTRTDALPKNNREFTNFSYGPFLRELPETQFYEGDEVQVYALHPSLRNLMESPLRTDNMPRFCEQHRMNPDKLIVVSIDYSACRANQRVYVISDSASNAGNAGIHAFEFQLELKNRGNLWKALHNEQTNFKNLADEVSLNLLLGQYDYVLTPENDFRWEKEDAWKCIRQDGADGFMQDALRPDPALLGNGSFNLVKYDDRELGKRVREVTLAKKSS